jgi:outer membrane protein OmpA-like peptidoglycan-associated protein/tetratricopeptide (TPR) repeat protein
MKKYFFTASAVLAITFAQAQFAYDYQRAANDYYAKGDYHSATVYYEKYLADGKGKSGPTYDPYTIQKMSKQEKAVMLSKQQSVYNLAESYRLLNFHVKAEPHYKEAIGFDRTAFPLVKFRYATTLRALQKFDEAEKYFKEFLSEYTIDDTYRETAQREVANIDFIKSQLSRGDLALFTVKKAAPQINTTGASYAPVLMNNTFLFTSTRPDSNAVKNNVYINRIYSGDVKGTEVENINRVAIPQETDIHQGSVTFSANGNIMYLTRWTISGNQKKTAIYTSRKNGKGWDEPVMLESTINTPGANTQQPFVAGNILYYASDRAGSLGGFDLWYATLDASGTPSNPQNLGSTINTKYDEQAPYYHVASGTLVFSTNGRVGMGGYDFFSSKGSAGTWAEPVNFGHPVNSVKDDIYFTSKGTERNILESIYFSSDRSAECCLELFTLNKVKPMTTVSGMVVSCNGNLPISGATVNIIDTVSNQTLFTKVTGADGKYSIELPEVIPLKAVASAEGYLPNAVHFTKPAIENIVLNNPTICLFDAPKADGSVTVDNIYYDFNSASLRDESFPVLDQLVSMMNENKSMRLEMGAHTDSKGTDAYNLKLSDARAKSVVDYLIGKGIASDRLEAKGYGESKPIADNANADGSDNPEGRQKNRRTEFKIIK